MNEYKTKKRKEKENKRNPGPELYAWVQKISDSGSILANIQLQSGGSWKDHGLSLAQGVVQKRVCV